MTTPPRPLTIAVYLTLVGVIILIAPYLPVLVIASVMAVLAWPVQEWMTTRFRGRRSLAGLATVALLTVGVVAPAGPLALIATREVTRLVTEAGAGMQTASWEELLAKADASPPAVWLAEWTGDPTAVSESVRSVTADAAGAIGGVLTTQVPALVSLTFHAFLNLLLFYVAVYAFLVKGPALYKVVAAISPIEERHLARLFDVFAQFARNVVLAGVVAAAAQGVVGGIGYLLAGVERALLLGLVTAALSVVPIVGSAIIWVPLVFVLVAQGRIGAAVFLGLWSALVTGTVDNFIRPFIVKGRSEVPILMVFLGVFSGLGALGLAGLVIGPVAMALLLALIKIYKEEKER